MQCKKYLNGRIHLVKVTSRAFISTNIFIADQLLLLCTTQWKETEILQLYRFLDYIDSWVQILAQQLIK